MALPKPSQFFLNAGVSLLAFHDVAELRFTVRNLTDLRGSDLRGYQLPGRTSWRRCDFQKTGYEELRRQVLGKLIDRPMCRLGCDDADGLRSGPGHPRRALCSGLDQLHRRLPRSRCSAKTGPEPSSLGRSPRPREPGSAHAPVRRRGTDHDLVHTPLRDGVSSGACAW